MLVASPALLDEYAAGAADNDGASASSSSGSTSASALKPSLRPHLRRLDLILAPLEQWSFVQWGWTGSTMVERQMREYVKHMHEGGKDTGPWKITGGRPVHGVQGWQLDADERRTGEMIYGRQLNFQKDSDQGEYWQLSQNSLKIMRGRVVSASFQGGNKRPDPVPVYEEDPSLFKCEKDIFDRFYIPFLEPHERQA